MRSTGLMDEYGAPCPLAPRRVGLSTERERTLYRRPLISHTPVFLRDSEETRLSVYDLIQVLREGSSIRDLSDSAEPRQWVEDFGPHDLVSDSY